ncbi:MAG TPA: hypothetical protein CFH84_10040 [Sulfurimonas sp. UBA12504]|nr:MAG TPA: hypothetical protein CFH84_10040 [Sulfurimonas sp. UBA12504]
MSKNIRTMTLKERFDRRGFAVSSYARAYGVEHAILSKVLDGVLDGTKGHRGGSTRRIIAQLKEDKIWIGKLPWELSISKEEVEDGTAYEKKVS